MVAAAPVKTVPTTYSTLPSCTQSPGTWYCFGEGETFGESYNGYVEHGNDIDTPFHTPITALLGGIVTDSSYQPWGGQVGVQTPNGDVAYYQHLDEIASNITPGSTITPGEFLGLSGGQLAGGQHPTTTQYSTGPHTEFGFNAPWVAGTTNANFNSQPILNAAVAGNVPSQGAGGSTPQCNGCTIAGICVNAGPLNDLCYSAPSAAGYVGDVTGVGAIVNFFQQPDAMVRVGLVVGGAILILIMLGKVAS